MHQSYHCQKIYRGSLTENCGGLYNWGTERVPFIVGNLKADRITLGYCAHLLINLRDIAKYKSMGK